MLDWNDLQFFLAVARERKHPRSGARTAGQPDDRRSPDRGARRGARLAALRQAPGGLCADARRTRPCPCVPSRSRGPRPLLRTRPRPFARSSAGRSRSRPRKSSQSPCCRRCSATLHEQHPRHPHRAGQRRRRSATSAPAKPTSPCAAPRLGPSRRACRPRPVYRRLVALLQPRLCGTERHSPLRAEDLKTACVRRRRRRQFVAPLPGLDRGTWAREPGRDAPAALPTGLLAGVRSGFGIARSAVHRRRRRSRPHPLPSAARRTMGAPRGF